MIFVTMDELRSKVDFERFTVELIQECFAMIANHERQHYLFTNSDEYREKSIEYAAKQGWDLETTLVLFEIPPTEEERAVRDAAHAEAEAKAMAEDPDYEGDCTVGSVDPKQMICSIYPNCTFEKMFQTFNTVGRLKAFL